MPSRQSQPQRTSTAPSGQARPLTAPTGGITQRSATPSKAGLLSSLSCGSLAPTDALEPTPRPATSASPASIDDLFKLFMRTYMYTVKNQAQVQASVQVFLPPVEPKKQPLKARFPDLYFGKLHLDCYRFYHQYEDYFDTAIAHGDNRIPFAASFLRDGISTFWTQYKRWHALEKGIDVFIPWDKFKAFFRENLGNSRTFVKGI